MSSAELLSSHVACMPEVRERAAGQRNRGGSVMNPLTPSFSALIFLREDPEKETDCGYWRVINKVC